MSRVVEILKEEEIRLKAELADIRAALQMLNVGPKTVKKPFSGVSDDVARKVAYHLRDQNLVLRPEDIAEALSISVTAAREGARKAVSIFPEVTRFKDVSNRYVYRWKSP